MFFGGCIVGCGDFLDGGATVVLAIEAVMSSIGPRCGRFWVKMGLVMMLALAIDVVTSFAEDMCPLALGR